MKKRLIALSVTIIMLLHILATPTYAIIEEVEDLKENSQQEETQEIQETPETQETPEEPKQEENKEEGEEEKVEPKKAPALKSPEQPVGVVEDKTLQEVININLGFEEDHILTAEDMLGLDQLEVYGVQSFAGLEYAKNLILLTVSGNEANVFDFSVVQNMSKLNMLCVQDIEGISNLQVVNSLTTLKTLEIEFLNEDYINTYIEELQKLNRKTDLTLIIKQSYVNDRESINTLLPLLNNLNVKYLIYDRMFENLTLEEPVAIGTTVTYDYAELSPILGDYILNPESVFYRSKFEIYPYSYEATVNNETQKLTLNTVESPLGSRSAYLEVSYWIDEEEEAVGYANIYLNYLVANPGDRVEEIEFENKDLETQIKSNYDIDHNGKITQFDLNNIEYLDIINITDLYDLEKFTNLTSLTLRSTDKNIPVDFYIFRLMENLDSLTIERASNLSHIDTLNTLSNLTYLDIQFANPEEVSNLNTIQNKVGLYVYVSLLDKNFDDVYAVAKALETCPVSNVEFPDIYMDLEVEEPVIIGGDPLVFDYTEYPLFGEFGLNPESRFYISDLEFVSSNEDYIIIDNQAKTITIKADEGNVPGRMSVYVDAGYVAGGFNISFRMIYEGLSDEPVNIPDNNLRDYLVENYDFNHDGEISEGEMASVLDINAYNVENAEGIQYAINLQSLYISGNHERNLCFDFSLLQNMPNLGYLYLDNLERVINCDSLNNLANLTTMTVSFKTLNEIANSNSELRKLNRTEDFYLRIYTNENNSDRDIDLVAELLEGVGVKKIYFNNLYRSKTIQENILVGESKTYTFDEINPFLNKYILNSTSKFYNDNPNFTASDNSRLSINMEERTITISAEAETEARNRYEWFDYQVEISRTLMYRGNMAISYYVAEDGDHETPIHFNDLELERAIKNNYDIDGNGIITEYDMINITNLYADSICDLEGLQYARNLTDLSINSRDGSLASISALNGLNKLSNVRLYWVNNFDCANLAGMEGLTNLTVSGIESIDNVASLNTIPNLYVVDFSFRDYGEIVKLGAIENKENLGLVIGLETEYYGETISNEDLANIVEDIEERINVNKVILKDLFQNIDLGYVQPNEPFSISFYDANPWINYVKYNNPSKLYRENLTLYERDYEDFPGFEIDNENDQFIITASDEDTGEQIAHVNVDVSLNESWNYQLSFEVKYRVMAEGDANKEVVIADNELSRYIKDNYNLDGNYDFISEFEMHNIDEIRCDNTTTTLEGLENAINLKRLRLNNTRVTDFSALRAFTKLDDLDIYSIYQGQDLDFQALEDCNNLRNLSISVRDGFNCMPLVAKQNLSTCYITASRIYNAPILNDLENIRNVSLCADLIDGIEGLEDISIPNATIEVRIQNNSGVEFTDQEYDAFINKISRVNAYKLIVNMGRIIIDLGTIQADGEPIEIPFMENPIIAQVEQESPFHKANLQLNPSNRTYPNNNEDVNINYETRKIEITPTSIGDEKICLQLGDEYTYWGGESGKDLNAYIEIRFRTIMEGDPNKIIEIPDDNFRRIIEQDYNMDGEPGVSEYDIKNIKSIYLYDVHNLSGIENATNLETLEIYVYEDTDLTPLTSLNNLKELRVYIESANANLTPIVSIPNLAKLRVYGYIDEEINLNPVLTQMQNLTSLTIQIPQSTITGITSMTNLQELDIKMPNDRNLAPINGLTNLNRLAIRAIEEALDYNQLNNFQNLNHLELEFYNIQSIVGTNGGFEVLNVTSYDTSIYIRPTYEISTQEEQTMLNEINKIPANSNAYVSFNIRKRIENMTLNEQKTYETYNEFSPILAATKDSSSRLYNINASVNDWSSEYLKINTNPNNVVVTAGDKIGEVNASLNFNGMNTYGYISVAFNVITEEGSTTNLIDFGTNTKLRDFLTENYNIDGEPGFSERDMLNLTMLDMYEADIDDLYGLQYAVNLRELMAGANKIRSIEPILKLTQLNNIDLNNNEITDLTCLSENTWANGVFLDIGSNFIDLSNGSDNLTALENFIAKAVDTNMGYTVSTQKVGDPDDFDNEVTFGDANVEAKLIEMGVKTNEHGKMTRRTLYEATNEYGAYSELTPLITKLDLDNMNISDLSGFEYLGQIQELILSNNQITSIAPLKYLANLKDLNLSHNNISDLRPLSKYIGSASWGDRELRYDLSANNISFIAPLSNWEIITHTSVASQYGYSATYRKVNINLAENNITSIDGVENWKNITWLDLGDNQITDISNLANFNFEVWPDAVTFIGQENMVEQLDKFRGIRLTNNQINFGSEGTDSARNVFNQKNVPLILEDEEPPLPPFTLGDVDNNGVVNATDYTMIVRYLKGYEQLNDIQLLAADTDKNGVVNATDYTKIVRFLKGYETLE